MNNFDKKIPYNDLPLLPPEGNVENNDIFRKTISASRAMSLPNPIRAPKLFCMQKAACKLSACTQKIPKADCHTF
jgi:hypothetical protein